MQTRNTEGLTLQNPTNIEAYNKVKSGLSQHKTIIIAGNCSVEYDGRAASQLKPGERLIILKSDGSALVHRPRDYSPVNWQPSGSLFNTRISEGNLIIRIYRAKEKESLEITLIKVLMVAVLDLRDKGEFILYASEKDMQEAILFDPSLLEDGFRPLETERTVEPGFIDIIGVDKENSLTLVEIKRNPATKKDVQQLHKYMKIYNINNGRTVRGILVAPEIKKNAKKELNRLGYEFKALTPQECSNILKRKKSKALTDFFT